MKYKCYRNRAARQYARRRAFSALLLCAMTAAGFGAGPMPKIGVPEDPANPAFEPIQEDPNLPRVLLIGDSISIGYTLPVRKLLEGRANLLRIPVNGGPTARGIEMLDAWLGGRKFDVIHFNWGLHDVKHRRKENLEDAGDWQVPPDQYRKNLEILVQKLKTTGARLIWASTTPIPQGVNGRTPGDEIKANQIAAAIMNQYAIPINDLHSSVLPHLDQFQRPRNVHFNPEGSDFLAQHVAESIEKALSYNAANPLPSMYYADVDYGAPFAKDPDVVRFQGRYLLYYSLRKPGGIGIGIAESRDLTQWRKCGELDPAAEYELKGVAAPAAIVHEGKVHLFYQTYGNGPRDALCHAVSEDGLRFIRNPTNPIFAPSGTWTVGRAIDAEVLVDGDTAFLYGATRDPDMKRQMLFVATASVNRGFQRASWTQRCDRPILEPELPWEKNCIEAPALIKRGALFFMFYAGGYNNDPQQIGLAVSTDGIQWKRLSDEPLLPNGPANAWNQSESGHPGVFSDDNGETWLFFQGNSDHGKTWFLSKMRMAWNGRDLPYLIRPEDGQEYHLLDAPRLRALKNPILDLTPNVFPRDPLLVQNDGIYHCYFTAAEQHASGFHLSLDEIRSSDLVNWSPPRRILSGPENFSSPGSMLHHDGRWIMALQSYPIPPGNTWADDSARLWLIESGDLEQWTPPRPMKPEGCTAQWAKSRRQIDPCVVAHDGNFYCFYKTDGQLGLLRSQNLLSWEEALPARPVLPANATPDGAALENVCLVKQGGQWRMFFSPCRDKRGIGVAVSSNLLDWHDIYYLDFPEVSWADNGPTAPMILDQRETRGVWLMLFHGERRLVNPHAAALGLAWSRDLQHWTLPGHSD